MDRKQQSTIYKRSGRLLDRYVAKTLSDLWMSRLVESCESGVDYEIGQAKVQIKTSNSFAGHVLLEHTARGGEPGWMFGGADWVVQAISSDFVVSYDLHAAREYVRAVYGEPPVGLEPVPMSRTKVSGRWISRDHGDGDVFIYVPTVDILAECNGSRIKIPMLDSLTSLCKNVRNHNQPDDVRLASLARLEEFVSG